MFTLQVYENKNKQLVGEPYQNDEINSTKRMTEKEIINFISYLNKNKNPISIKTKQECLMLKYKDEITVILNEFEKYCSKKGINDVIEEFENKTSKTTEKKVSKKEIKEIETYIEKFEEKPKKITKNEKLKKKKVERRNKYAKRIVVFATATVMTLVATNMVKKYSKNIDKAKEKIDVSTKVEEITEIKVENPTIETTLHEKNEINTTKVETTKEETTKVETTKEETTKKINESTTKIFESLPNNGKQEYDYNVSLDYEDRRYDPDYCEKYKFVTSDHCMQYIEKYAKEYGLDPKLVIAIATQETDTKLVKAWKENPNAYPTAEICPAGGIGMMQVQYNVWAGSKLTAHNFVTNEDETVTVDGDRLGDLEYNTKIGCMVLRHYIEKADYNLACAVFGYNKGIYGILSKAGESVKDPEDLSWIEDGREVSNGDDYYPEHVFGFIGNNANITLYQKNGTPIIYNVNNNITNTKTR